MASCKAPGKLFPSLGLHLQFNFFSYKQFVPQYWLKISRTEITTEQDINTNVVSNLNSAFDISWTYSDLTAFVSYTFSFSLIQWTEKKG